MTELEAKIKQEVKRLLEEKIVDIVIAFKKGDTPIHPQPAFFTDPTQLDELVYNGLCQNNLATYLTRYPLDKRIGMVVRGCDNRSVNALIVENQHTRENMFLIGIPCSGIIDWRNIVNQVGEDILSIVENEDEVHVKTRDQVKSFNRKELLHDSCLRCIHPNPISADIVIGDMLEEGDPTIARSEVAEFANLSHEERYNWFKHEAERCIRCYACREACPMCYCEECFVDHLTPKWTESSVSPAGMQAWHIVRAFHQAGRCTSCGACERACPMDIKMTYLTEKLNEDMRIKYNFEVGLDSKTQPPFATVTLDDKNRFTV